MEKEILSLNLHCIATLDECSVRLACSKPYPIICLYIYLHPCSCRPNKQGELHVILLHQALRGISLVTRPLQHAQKKLVVKTRLVLYESCKEMRGCHYDSHITPTAQYLMQAL